MKMTINDDDQDANWRRRWWWWWRGMMGMMMMMMVMTTGDDDDDGRHERGHAKIAVPRAQEELTALYQDRDGWLQLSQDSPYDQMKMLMIIILCCIVSDNHKYYIQGQSHYFTCASYEPDPRNKPAHLLLCIFQYYSCNWNGRNITFILGKLWVGKMWSALHPIIVIFRSSML